MVRTSAVPTEAQTSRAYCAYCGANGANQLCLLCGPAVPTVQTAVRRPARRHSLTRDTGGSAASRYLADLSRVSGDF
eukprot:scaffold49071_cov59-Phaeocystis_antarctica.AAC.11